MEKKSILTLILIVLLGLSSVLHAETVYGPTVFSADHRNFLTNTYYHVSTQIVTLDSQVDGKLMVQKQGDAEFKRGFVVFNLNVISLTQFLTGSEETFGISARLKRRNLLTVYFAGENNAAISLALDDGTAVAAPEIMSFTATPETIDYGESITLEWEVENADSVSIDNGVGQVDAGL